MTAASPKPMLIVVSGMSGSGKSVALRTLEATPPAFTLPLGTPPAAPEEAPEETPTTASGPALANEGHGS